MDLKGIIFDLDGVLCYTDHYHYLAWKSLADRLGLPFDEQVNNRLRGVSRMESLDIVLSLGDTQYSPEEKAVMAEQKNDDYRTSLLSMGPESLATGALETLDSLRALGLRLAIGSSSKNTPLILKRTGLERRFDAVADGNHIINSKPHPEVFLLAAEKLGLNPQQCMVVEDALAGIQAAKAGGFLAVGIGDAHCAAGTDYPITSLRELVPLCRTIARPSAAAPLSFGVGSLS